MIGIYRCLGLHLIKAKKDIEGNIYAMRQRIEPGYCPTRFTLIHWRSAQLGTIFGATVAPDFQMPPIGAIRNDLD
jgi:hypothetical protein